MRKFKMTGLIVLTFLLSCVSNSDSFDPEIHISKAVDQLSLLVSHASQEERIPRTVNKDGIVHWCNPKFDWTSGFFPGTCWYLFQMTQDEKWQKAAEKFQAQFEHHKTLTTNHDLGFVFNCSYGNGYRLTKNPAYKDVMITAANALLTRFNPNVGCIKSWDVSGGWQAKRGWEFPVIVDNMMNLELLFEVSELTGDPTYKDAAILHATTTMRNHFRKDNSSYHVVDYDATTGEIRGKYTAQGYTNDSSWARGQAWGLYGYTICYRYTKNPMFLKQAENIATFIIEHENLPSDGIPYWDFNAPNVPHQYRDVSAAAIATAALLELNTFSDTDYKPTIDTWMSSLASDTYSAQKGENNNFVLMHSVGSIPHNNEIDVPLTYADYYYIEALTRYKNLN